MALSLPSYCGTTSHLGALYSSNCTSKSGFGDLAKGHPELSMLGQKVNRESLIPDPTRKPSETYRAMRLSASIRVGTLKCTGNIFLVSYLKFRA